MKTRALLLAALVAAAAPAPLFAKPKKAKSQTARTLPGVNHIVQPGETLFSIAEKYYGSGYEWVKLKEYNTWLDQPDQLNIGEILYIPDPKRSPGDVSEKQKSLNVPGTTSSMFAWMPDMRGITLFGRSLAQIALLALTWFLGHFSIQGLFVWFAAHIAFVKDVSLKKAMHATLQSESLAFICILMAALVGLMLLYVGTTSPGKPVTSELLATAEEYLASPGGLVTSGALLVVLYAFLGIRFIPQAFGIQSGRGVTVVLLAILLPHLIGMYLVGHRMGLIN